MFCPTLTSASNVSFDSEDGGREELKLNSQLLWERDISAAGHSYFPASGSCSNWWIETPDFIFHSEWNVPPLGLGSSYYWWFGLVSNWCLWAWALFFRVRLSPCQYEHLCKLLISLITIQTPSESAFYCLFLFFFLMRLPRWDSVLLSGSLLCYGLHCHYLWPSFFIIWVRMSKIDFLRSIIRWGVYILYLLSEDTISFIVFWCIKILHLNFRESLFYYFFLFLFLANSKKDQIMKYCYSLHCPHLLQPRGQLSGACASELLQYF